jgi:hypothetical protein
MYINWEIFSHHLQNLQNNNIDNDINRYIRLSNQKLIRQLAARYFVV